MNHLYLHGFASGPTSRKAVAVGQALAKLGTRLDAPDLNLPSFEHLTITAMCAEAERRLKPSSVVWGSSLGAYLATQLWARHPKQVEKLVLFAPAIAFPEVYPARAADARRAWARGGTVPVFHHAQQRALPLAGDLAADCANWPSRPRVECPTLVIAAKRDEVIPLPTIEAWVKDQPRVELTVLDDSHDLNQVVPQVVARAFAFLGLG